MNVGTDTVSAYIMLMFPSPACTISFRILLLLLLLLLLAAMTYSQVQLFQINDFANNYVDIEITGYRAL